MATIVSTICKKVSIESSTSSSRHYEVIKVVKTTRVYLQIELTNLYCITYHVMQISLWNLKIINKVVFGRKSSFLSTCIAFTIKWTYIKIFPIITTKNVIKDCVSAKRRSLLFYGFNIRMIILSFYC